MLSGHNNIASTNSKSTLRALTIKLVVLSVKFFFRHFKRRKILCHVGDWLKLFDNLHTFSVRVNIINQPETIRNNSKHLGIVSAVYFRSVNDVQSPEIEVK